MLELHTPAELVAACGDDPLCLWAGQGMTGPARAWAVGPGLADGSGTGLADAVAVASPDLSCRDRIAVWGGPGPAARLVDEVLRLTGPSFRPLGSHALISQLCQRLPRLQLAKEFGWMATQAHGPAPIAPRRSRPDDGTGTPRWLDADDMPAVDRLLDSAFPGSYARPGVPGVRRWAGVTAPGGQLAAVAADAWAAPTVGLLAGVAVSEAHRGGGLGGRVCRFVVAELIARHGRVALMVERSNAPAIAIYRRLGLSFRLSAAASVSPR